MYVQFRTIHWLAQVMEVRTQYDAAARGFLFVMQLRLLICMDCPIYRVGEGCKAGVSHFVRQE